MAATEDLLGELDEISDVLDGVDRLYERRVEIIAELRKADPPMKVAEIAARARISEGAATQVVRTAKQRGLL